MDPGVRARRRISFKSANLIGSLQDDVKFMRNVKSEFKIDIQSKFTSNIERVLEG